MEPAATLLIALAVRPRVSGDPLGPSEPPRLICVRFVFCGRVPVPPADTAPDRSIPSAISVRSAALPVLIEPPAEARIPTAPALAPGVPVIVTAPPPDEIWLLVEYTQTP